MITAVKLTEYDPQRGFLMRSYTSATLMAIYRSGRGDVPSAWRIVEDPGEIAELREIRQFDVQTFASVQDLEEHVQKQMERAAREGRAPVRALVEGLPAEYQATLQRTTAAAQAKPEPPRVDLSVMADVPQPPPMKREVSPERIDVDKLEIDYPAEIAALEAKIKRGKVSQSTIAKYKRQLRRLRVEWEDEQRAPAEDANTE